MTTAAFGSVAPGQGRHWALFADWCTATDRASLPATPDTILAFFGDIPAGSATILRRLRAVDTAHRTAGFPAPSTAPAFDRLLRPVRSPLVDPDLVGRALDLIPVGGWPTGMIGRRDAALVAVVCTAGFTRRQSRNLRSEVDAHGQLGVPGLPVLPTTRLPGPCPACALTRWLRVHAGTAVDGWRAVRADLADLGEVLAGTDTTHDCTRPLLWPLTPGERGTTPLFAPINRHGTPETWSISTRSITTIVATRLAAVPRAALSEDGWHVPPSTAGEANQSWGADDRARVVAERKAAADRFADIESSLDAADAYAESVLARLNAALRSNRPGGQPPSEAPYGTG